MPEPIAFTDETPRLALPYLFAGQSQKELFVNRSLARLDAAVHCAVEGTASAPPDPAEDGRAWLVAGGASGAWQGWDDAIAARRANDWLRLDPVEGMRVLDLATGQSLLRRDGAWLRPAAPAVSEGGSTIDREARDTIATLIDALRESGVFARDPGTG